MTRRDRIREGLGASGGTAAPNGRRKQIREALGRGQPRGPGGRSEVPGRMPPPKRFPEVGNRKPAEGPLSVVPGGGRPMPTGRPGPDGKRIGQGISPGPFRVAGSGKGGPGVGGNFQAGLGKQLSGRVQSGALTQGKAQQVARQRGMLQKAFGSDWRKQVFGQGGAKGISGPFAQRQVAAKRSQGLARAKRKLY